MSDLQCKSFARHFDSLFTDGHNSGANCSPRARLRKRGLSFSDFRPEHIRHCQDHLISGSTKNSAHIRLEHNIRSGT